MITATGPVQNIQIVFSADDLYAQHLGVAITSLLSNLKPGLVPCFHVITNSLSDVNRKKLESLKSIRDFSINYLMVSPDDFQIYPMTLGHLTMATYFRLKTPYLLPDLDKVIYLDVDTVTVGDIAPLWDIDLSPDEWIGGVQDLIVDKNVFESIGLPKDGYYFNAGVTLMNLSALRQNHFEEKCIEFVQHYGHAIRYVDQDVMNHVCQGHVKWIHPKYNFMFGEIYKTYHWHDHTMPYTPAIMEEAVAHPVIVHFWGPGKPWFYRTRNLFAYKYNYYLKQTPWKNYHYPDKNFGVFLSNQLFFLRKKLKKIRSS